MKKIISLVICLIMAFSLFVFSVAAAQECNHSYTTTVVPPTCVDAGYTQYVCSLCGDNYKNFSEGAPALKHSFGEWFNVETASCTEEGFDQRNCTRCGSFETKTIGVIPHNDSNGDGKCDSCSLLLDTEITVSPFDWLVALFNFIKQWFADLFA